MRTSTPQSLLELASTAGTEQTGTKPDGLRLGAYFLMSIIYHLHGQFCVLTLEAVQFCAIFRRPVIFRSKVASLIKFNELPLHLKQFLDSFLFRTHVGSSCVIKGMTYNLVSCQPAVCIPYWMEQLPGPESIAAFTPAFR